jgi:hypothetical protein
MTLDHLLKKFQSLFYLQKTKFCDKKPLKSILIGIFNYKFMQFFSRNELTFSMLLHTSFSIIKTLNLWLNFFSFLFYLGSLNMFSSNNDCGMIVGSAILELWTHKITKGGPKMDQTNINGIMQCCVGIYFTQIYPSCTNRV